MDLLLRCGIHGHLARRPVQTKLFFGNQFSIDLGSDITVISGTVFMYVRDICETSLVEATLLCNILAGRSGEEWGAVSGTHCHTLAKKTKEHFDM